MVSGPGQCDVTSGFTQGTILGQTFLEILPSSSLLIKEYTFLISIQGFLNVFTLV